MAEALNKLERRILDYIVDYLRENTYQPSIREIGKRFGIKSTKTVSEHLQALSEKGYIEREASRSRAVRIFDLDLRRADAIRIPCYGSIAAGEPALLEDNVEGEYYLDPALTGGEQAFFLRVKGDSMDEMGIRDGDLVLVRPVAEEEIENGEIVAARVDGEGTVKRYFERDSKVVLEPANTDYAPMLVHEYDDFAVLGRVVGLYRQFTPQQTRAIGG